MQFCFCALLALCLALETKGGQVIWWQHNVHFKLKSNFKHCFWQLRAAHSSKWGDLSFAKAKAKRWQSVVAPEQVTQHWHYYVKYSKMCIKDALMFFFSSWYFSEYLSLKCSVYDIRKKVKSVWSWELLHFFIRELRIITRSIHAKITQELV